jgi:hypothetical protein
MFTFDAGHILYKLKYKYDYLKRDQSLPIPYVSPQQEFASDKSGLHSPGQKTWLRSKDNSWFGPINKKGYLDKESVSSKTSIPSILRLVFY